MIRVAIIGCGKIADQHVSAIQLMNKDCKIVAVCDKELLMAKQLADRFKIDAFFADPNELLKTTVPDAVHITTPPQNHYELGRLFVSSGCHVYIEKPFAITSEETINLIQLAQKHDRIVTVGHDAQFMHCALDMRRIIRGGYLGGVPVHMESYFSYDLSNPTYARALLGDKTHWVRLLPGKLLHNLISHGISKIAEFLRSEDPVVIAYGFNSPIIKSIGETDIIDELRVIIDDKVGTTAYFSFSSQMMPQLHEFRIYGPKNSLVVDYNHQTVIKLRGAKYRSFLDQVVPQFSNAKQNIASSLWNFGRFADRRLHLDHGMRFLIESFYRSIRDNAVPPIPYSEIILTSRIMDNIFSQISLDKKKESKI